MGGGWVGIGVGKTLLACPSGAIQQHALHASAAAANARLLHQVALDHTCIPHPHARIPTMPCSQPADPGDGGALGAGRRQRRAGQPAVAVPGERAAQQAQLLGASLSGWLARVEQLGAVALAGAPSIPTAVISPTPHLASDRPAAVPAASPQMLAYLAGVLVPATQHFVWLMAGSCCVVATAALLFTSFAARSGCGRGVGVTPQPV